MRGTFIELQNEQHILPPKKLSMILDLQLSRESGLSVNEIDSVGESFLVGNCGMYDSFLKALTDGSRDLHFQPKVQLCITHDIGLLV